MKKQFELCKTCIGHMVYQCEHVCLEENGFNGYIQDPSTKQLYLLKRDGRGWAKGNIDYINEVIKSAMEYDGIKELNITIERLKKRIKSHSIGTIKFRV